MYASSNSSIGLDASSVSDYAIVGQTTNGYAGVHGAGGHNGVFGETNSATDAGVFGRNNRTSNGVFGFSAGGNGVDGFTQTGYAAVHGFGGHNGVFGETNSSTDAGVFARNNGAGNGVYGRSVSGTGVYGFSESGYAGVFDGRVAVHVLQINGGSDVAEPFSIDGDETAAPGTVVIIDDQNPGKLKVSQSAYDHRVAGIVSGAGGIQPGVTLQQDNLATGTTMVAIAGRVYTRAEALSEPIMPGDLLTTSGETGCAMKATDKDRSRGAIIGKAMSSLRGGTGLVLVLVNLQ